MIKHIFLIGGLLSFVNFCSVSASTPVQTKMSMDEFVKSRPWMFSREAHDLLRAQYPNESEDRIADMLQKAREEEIAKIDEDSVKQEFKQWFANPDNQKLLVEAMSKKIKIPFNPARELIGSTQSVNIFDHENCDTLTDCMNEKRSDEDTIEEIKK